MWHDVDHGPPSATPAGKRTLEKDMQEVTSSQDPARLIARVKYVDAGRDLAYLQLQNGTVVPCDFPIDGEAYNENDVVLIGPRWDDIEAAPAELWTDPPWVGIVRAILENEVIVNINGLLKALSRPDDVELKEGNTVEGNDVTGVTRVLSPKPIKQLEISLGEPFDVGRLRKQPDGSVSYDDFGGYADVKARTKELIELPLLHRDALLKIQAKAIKGVLFTGPSGTGKTMLGRIIAQQAGAQFYMISGPEIISKYVGESEDIIRSIFEDAKAQERAIIFFDEIDSVAPQRSDESHESSRRLVGQLLTLLDGFENDTNVIVIATTNRPQDIDVALRRPGRFDWEIHFGYPGRNDRVEILVSSSRKLNVSDGLPHHLIADRTSGWSPAELVAIWSDAALLAVMDRRDVILAEDYLGGYERVAKQKQLVEMTRRNEPVSEQE
jgi:transitional endoplasmic reticulum ATPase